MAASPFEFLARSLITQYCDAHPTQAVRKGLTITGGDHHTRWPAVKRGVRVRQIKEGLRRLKNPCTDPEEEVDRRILLRELELERLEIEVEKPWMCDPLWSAQVLLEGLRQAPRNEEGFAQSPSPLLWEALPAYIQRIQRDLDPGSCLRVRTEVAIQRLDCLSGQIPFGRPGDMDPILDHIRYLKEQVLPLAQGPAVAAPDVLGKKVRLLTGMSHTDLFIQAGLEQGTVFLRMHALAQELAGPLECAPHVEAVLATLSKWQAPGGDLLKAAKGSLRRLQSFAKDLVPLDEGLELCVVSTPAALQGVSMAGLSAPPHFGPANGGSFYYCVHPVPEGQSDLLSEYNLFMLEVLSIHEAMPGHFVQISKERSCGSRVRKAFPDPAFREGWAGYMEQAMLDAGYKGAPPAFRPSEISEALWKVLLDDDLRQKALRIHGLKLHLRALTNALLEYDAVTTEGGLTEEEVMFFLTHQAFQSPSEARMKYRRMQLAQGQLSTYAAGALQFAALRRKADEEGLEPLEFHRRVLELGAIPLCEIDNALSWIP